MALAAIGIGHRVWQHTQGDHDLFLNRLSQPSFQINPADGMSEDLPSEPQMAFTVVSISLLETAEQMLRGTEDVKAGGGK